MRAAPTDGSFVERVFVQSLKQKLQHRTLPAKPKILPSMVCAEQRWQNT
jgi:hypothetical protein